MPRSSHGMTTHLSASSPSGRVVMFADGTLTSGWADENEPRRRGFVAITADGRGHRAIDDDSRKAKDAVCEALGLSKRYIIGKGEQ
jgi:hypothetical protein